MQPNFREILGLLTENAARKQAAANPKVGSAARKESAKAKTSDPKSRDTARKRVERGAKKDASKQKTHKQNPRDSQSKDVLVKEMMLVKTRGGKTHIIYKESFDSSIHTPVSAGSELSIAEAQAAIKTDNFEQTQASKDLFGSIKKPQADEKEGSQKKEAEEKKKKEKQVKEQAEGKKSEPGKQRKVGKKMSEADVMQTLATMDPKQLQTVPFEVRQNYFQLTRQPQKATEFDDLTYDKLSTVIGLDETSNVSFNTQVRNAVLILGRTKAGASIQELLYMTSLKDGLYAQFNKSAFAQAKKILSQIGDGCLQSLVSTTEIPGMEFPSVTAGDVDFGCGNYRFKINTEGEVSISTDSFSQESKAFKQITNMAVNRLFNDPNFIASDKNLQKVLQDIVILQGKVSPILFTNASFDAVKSNPQMMLAMQQMPVTLQDGQEVGPLVDPNGQLNPLASFDNFLSYIEKAGKGYMRGSKTIKGEFLRRLKNLVTTSWLRGDGIRPPELMPTHIVTANGIFPLNNDYLDEVSKKTDVVFKDAGELFAGTKSDLSNQNNKGKKEIARFRTLVEAKGEEAAFEEFTIPTASLRPNQLLADFFNKAVEMDFNMSLVPGLSPKDMSTVEYNTVHLNDKTVKIPVERDPNILSKIFENTDIFFSVLLNEGKNNSDIFAALNESEILEDYEITEIIVNEDENFKKHCVSNMTRRVKEVPQKLENFIEICEKRDYKKEYKNYHGKPEQRKKRSKRVLARRKLEKEGRVHKGDGKDVDHKRPLRSGGGNSRKNLRVRDRSKNRADNGHKKGERHKKHS